MPNRPRLGGQLKLSRRRCSCLTIVDNAAANPPPRRPWSRPGIWSGTGEVKNLTGARGIEHPGRRIPRGERLVTRPPPETSATLPWTGVGAHDDRA